MIASTAPGSGSVVLPLPDLAHRRPVDVAEALRDLPNLALLESARQGAAARWSYLAAGPLEVLEVPGSSAGGHALDGARRLLARMEAGPSDGADHGFPPFLGGLIGYLGYSFGSTLERRARSRHPPTPMPDLWFGLYDRVIAWDHQAGRAWLGGRAVDGDRARLGRRIAEFRARLEGVERSDGFVVSAGAPADVPAATGRPILPFTSSLEREAYEAAVGRVRAAIADGEIYQVNLTRRLATPYRADPWPLYRRLRDGDPAVNAAYLALDLGSRATDGVHRGDTGPGGPGPRAIVSASPEGFVALDSRGRVTSRPIKGTRPRGQDHADDRRVACELLQSGKDRAENVMIVDVVRNDLGRVCGPGTVAVPRLCRLERTDAVQHLVSTVTGRLRPGADAFDLLAAAFPGGSITGAPKIRAMELIDAFEPVARGPYTGALGWIGPDGAMATSMLIRTFVADGATLSLHVGGGITWRSEPAAEWAETVAKARGPLRAIGGVEIETGWGRWTAPEDASGSQLTVGPGVDRPDDFDRPDDADAEDDTDLAEAGTLVRVPIAAGGPAWWRR